MGLERKETGKTASEMGSPAGQWVPPEVGGYL